jgi:hypothetical protein
MRNLQQKERLLPVRRHRGSSLAPLVFFGVPFLSV